LARAGLTLLMIAMTAANASAHGMRPAPMDPAADANPLTFAVIGDYGVGLTREARVAQLVKSWNPAFVVTTGDDYYRMALGYDSTKYDNSTGQDYCPFLAAITTTGKHCPQPGPASTNAFFPALGNHDYSDAGTTGDLPTTYTNYFDLPGSGYTNTSGNERYYDFVQGPVHFFVLNSNPEEPDGTSTTSAQAAWLHDGLAASTSRWNIVIDHHPPYSSDRLHGSSTYMRWPFGEWGAQVVLSGHSHTYERVEPGDNVVYFVNGLGGAPRYPLGTPVDGSQLRYNGNWGAQRVLVTDTSLRFEFITVDGVVRDTVQLPGPAPMAMHVADLQSSANRSLLGWTAGVTVTVEDTDEKPVAGAEVLGVWSAGTSGQASCTTDAGGQCTVEKTRLSRRRGSVTFSVASITARGYTYVPADNVIVDEAGGAAGMITVVR
jgi:hypothetical protein